MKKNNTRLEYKSGFNQYVLQLIIDFYDIKTDDKYSYRHVIGRQEHYTYSQRFIEFIVSEIKKNPDNFVDSLKEKVLQ